MKPSMTSSCGALRPRGSEYANVRRCRLSLGKFRRAQGAGHLARIEIRLNAGRTRKSRHLTVEYPMDRRSFLKGAAALPLASAMPPFAVAAVTEKADYSLRIGAGLVELAPEHIVSTTLYNGQFPGPLLRLTEVSGSSSTSIMTPTPRSSCTGTVSSCPLMLTAPPRKARHTSRRVTCAASTSCRSHRASVSITPTSFP